MPASCAVLCVLKRRSPSRSGAAFSSEAGMENYEFPGKAPEAPGISLAVLPHAGTERRGVEAPRYDNGRVASCRFVTMQFHEKTGFGLQRASSPLPVDAAQPFVDIDSPCRDFVRSPPRRTGERRCGVELPQARARLRRTKSVRRRPPRRRERRRSCLGRAAGHNMRQRWDGPTGRISRAWSS